MSVAKATPGSSSRTIGTGEWLSEVTSSTETSLHQMLAVCFCGPSSALSSARLATLPDSATPPERRDVAESDFVERLGVGASEAAAHCTLPDMSLTSRASVDVSSAAISSSSPASSST
eukprot:6191798-Pleurochrysis_carterae.AAC.3